MIVVPSAWRERFLIVAIVVHAGATAFGLWHVVVGGLVNGNAAAARFGLVLGVVAGSLLTMCVAVLRRPRG